MGWLSVRGCCPCGVLPLRSGGGGLGGGGWSGPRDVTEGCHPGWLVLLLLLLSLAAALLSGPRLGAVGAHVAEGPTPQALGPPPLHRHQEVVPFLRVDQVQDLREGSPRRLHTEGLYPCVSAVFIVQGTHLPDGASCTCWNNSLNERPENRPAPSGLLCLLGSGLHAESSPLLRSGCRSCRRLARHHASFRIET